jgi:hypothetical protein
VEEKGWRREKDGRIKNSAHKDLKT